MKFSDKILSQTITQLCLAKDIDHIVISPGSRNAPLIIGFTENDAFHNYSIVDERCAAFFALGIAQQSKRPVALVCTSGSALLNYYPAIAEAFYSDIPLVVISADRPESLQEIGDGQTIRQENVYANHILYSANCIEGQAHQQYNETQINIALNTAIELEGPVHINLPFSDPLYQTLEDLSVRPQHVPARKLSYELTNEANDFMATWNRSAKKLVLIGVMHPNSIEAPLINKLAEDEGVVILTESTSNVHHEHIISNIDQLIASFSESDKQAFQPDLLLTFGGMVISKKIKALLRSFPPEKHWHVDKKKAYDTYFALSAHIAVPPNKFLKAVISEMEPVTSSYQTHWLGVWKERKERHASFTSEVAFSDFKVFSAIFSSIPEGVQLQLSNSATVRYAQLFDTTSSAEVFCNRGTSGIDGSTSTAIGAAVATQIPTILVTGDLSFFYDSNALWNEYLPVSFKIIIVNNSGGGIFRILPGAKKASKFETFFETRHELTSEALCAMHKLTYDKVTSGNELHEMLPTFLNRESGGVLEIFTPPTVNDRVLMDYFKYIS